MFQFIRYEAKDKSRWNDFVQEALNSNFLYHRNYLDYHADRFVDHSLLAFQGKKLKAVLPLNESNGEFFSHQGITYGGWIVAKRFSAEEYQELFKTLDEYTIQHGIKAITYKQKPSFFANHFNETESWVLWNEGWELFRKDLSFGFDLQHVPGFARDKRYRYNKSTRNDLRIDWKASSDEFMALVKTNLVERFGVDPVHTPEEVKMLQDRFPKNIKTISVYQGDVFLGGTWLFEDADFIHTQYLHTNDLGKELCAVEFLVQGLIERYSSKKRWFSFGTSTEDGGKSLNTGLASFKEGFGAAGFVHDFYKKTF